MSTSTTTWHGVDLRWAYADLLRGIHRRTGCMHKARDVLHDALVRIALVRQRDGGERIAQPHAYLRSVVNSALVDHHRDSALWVLQGDAADDDAAGQFAPSSEYLADLRQRLELLQKVLDCLPPRCREVFWLFRVEGHSQREIAGRLGISLNMVERHSIRAMMDLRGLRDTLGVQ